ncbi:MAG TPA: NAD-dependent dehydratase [Spirochaetia bacterium]|nr:NAD-dependent dehydratase [Spirochaetia bacterium]
MKYFIAGGAGFIGSSLVHRLLNDFQDVEIVIFDNFSSGKYEFLEDIVNDDRLQIVEGDIRNLQLLIECMRCSDIVVHLASNPDISKAITEPTIDFWQGTFLTQNILEAMRINGVKKIIYASGSGIYGDWRDVIIKEDQSPMLPVSTYGASKLAGEALISAYYHMFGIQAQILRFANVIGPNATHGVIFDLINKLKINPNQLNVLGRGFQEKSYVYIDDILDAIFTVIKNYSVYGYYNVATMDFITVREIVTIILCEMNLLNTKVNYGITDEGWRGDIVKTYLDSNKIRQLGWKNKYSTREAVVKTVKLLIEEL